MGRRIYLAIINPGMVIIGTPPDGTEDEAYSFTFTADGGTSPYTWAIIGGSLPDGLSLNGSTGEISGTPTTVDDYSFTVEATDSVGETGSTSFTVSIKAGVPWSPAQLFASGENGAYYDPSDSSTVWQDEAGTIPAGDGDPVNRIDDLSGNGNHATTSTNAPALRLTGGLYYLDFDRGDLSRLDVPGIATLPSGDDQPVSVVSAFDMIEVGGGGGVCYGWANSGDNNPLLECWFNASGGNEFQSMQKRDNSGTLKNSTVSGAGSGLFVRSEVLDGTQLKFYEDGVLLDTEDRDVGTTTLDTFKIGRRGGGGLSAQHTTIDVYAWFCIDREITAQERADLEAWAAERAGITL